MKPSPFTCSKLPVTLILPIIWVFTITNGCSPTQPSNEDENKSLKGDVSFSVLNTNSAPIAGALVEMIVYEERLNQQTGNTYKIPVLLTDTTNVFGKAQFAAIDTGSHQFWISAGGYRGFSGLCDVFEGVTTYILANLVFLDKTNGAIASADDSNVPQELRESFMDDAARLTLRRLKELNSSAYEEIEIPSEDMQTYYDSLIKVYNATSFSARDSVMVINEIHTFPNPTIHRMLVEVDTTYTWVKSWLNNQRLTGNAAIDSLMERYGLQINRIDDFVGRHIVGLITEQRLNMVALAEQFAQINGVIRAAQNHYIGRSRDILSPENRPTWLLLDFYLGWGDCPSGCIFMRTWRFQVYTRDNYIVYVGSWGDMP